MLPMKLSTALALLAAAVLLALVLHGWWQQRRIGKQAGPQAGPRATAEPLLPSERLEPTLGEDTAAEAPPLRSAPKRVLRLDALIDALVPLALEAPISGDMALQHLPPTRRAGSKPFYVEGLDSESGQWETLAAGRRYGELQAGVQMASRSGPLNEIEYSEFVQKLQAFADAVGATPQPPDMLEVVARGRNRCHDEPAGRAADGDFARQRCGLVGGFCAAGGRAPRPGAGRGAGQAGAARAGGKRAALAGAGRGRAGRAGGIG